MVTQLYHELLNPLERIKIYNSFDAKNMKTKYVTKITINQVAQVLLLYVLLLYTLVFLFCILIILFVYNLNLLYMDPVICIFIQQFKLYYALLMVWITCFNYFCFFLTKNNIIYFFITTLVFSCYYKLFIFYSFLIAKLFFRKTCIKFNLILQLFTKSKYKSYF